MSIEGATELITGKFLDGGGAFYNAAHPDFGSSFDDAVVTLAIAQADADGGGLVFVPPSVTQSAMPVLPTGVAYCQVVSTGLRWGGEAIFTDRVFMGDGSDIGGSDGVLTFSGSFTGNGRDLISAAATMDGLGNPLFAYVNTTFNITADGQQVGGMYIGATVNKDTFAADTYHGIMLDNPSVSGAGTITTAYGLRIASITVGSTNYAIKTGTGVVDFGGVLTTIASATGGAGFRVPHGTAPSLPVNGDLWTTTGGLFARINGSTVGPFASGLTGSGTANKVVKWTGASAVSDSSISDDGTTVTLANGRLTLTQTPAALGLVITQGSGSLTNAIQIVSGTDTGGGGPIVNIAQTWNNGATVFTGIKMNISKTAADSNSRLMTLQIGGVDRFAVGQNGDITAFNDVFAGRNVEVGNDLIVGVGGQITTSQGDATDPDIVLGGLGTDHGIFAGTSTTIGFAISALGEMLRIDDTVTARDTRLKIWDVDNAALERVSVGIADSGGAGFKLLRVPN